MRDPPPAEAAADKCVIREKTKRQWEVSLLLGSSEELLEFGRTQAGALALEAFAGLFFFGHISCSFGRFFSHTIACRTWIGLLSRTDILLRNARCDTSIRPAAENKR